ncbi:MAG: phospholipid-binding lipoprotein MlaA [Flavobacteriales bacterium]|jgi:phospholipid-binding lipoprotein MlaA
MFMRSFILPILFILTFVSGCASQQAKPLTDDEFGDSNEMIDRFEGYNRAMFSFNMTLDRWLLKPVAKGYGFVMPSFAKTGVNNFFGNVGEVSNILNDILQWKWKQASNDTGRLLVNSTIGIGGLWDVADKVGLEQSDGEDFGQTLSIWGVKQGPYIVLPLLGPSTLRDTVGRPVDYYSDPVSYVTPSGDKSALSVTRLIKVRESLLELESLVSGDKYLFIRDAYLQRRDYLIKDGELDMDFGGEDF